MEEEGCTRGREELRVAVKEEDWERGSSCMRLGLGLGLRGERKEMRLYKRRWVWA